MERRISLTLTRPQALALASLASMGAAAISDRPDAENVMLTIQEKILTFDFDIFDEYNEAIEMLSNLIVAGFGIRRITL